MKRITRASLARDARRIRAEIDQYLRDIAHWNRIRPDAPMDPDPDGQIARASEFVDRLLAATS